jgi:predicted kinase
MATLHVPVGIPGCGKTTWARQESAASSIPVVSTDEIRGQLRGDLVYRPDDNERVFALFHEQLREHLAAGRDAIADATNVWARGRDELRGLCDETGADPHFIVFANAEEAVARNAEREGDLRVPDEGMVKLLAYMVDAVFEIDPEVEDVTYVASATGGVFLNREQARIFRKVEEELEKFAEDNMVGQPSDERARVAIATRTWDALARYFKAVGLHPAEHILDITVLTKDECSYSIDYQVTPEFRDKVTAEFGGLEDFEDWRADS